MKYFFLFSVTILAASIYAQDNPQWLRHAAISPDGSQIAFTYKGDLYKVPAAGGTATQLTFHEAHDYMAVWSKDGSRLAFASNRYGNFDVYVMDAKGGNALRLTFHSNDERPYSFSADDKDVLFGALRQDDVKHRQYPHRSQSELYAVPTVSGGIRQVFTIPAEYTQLSKNGNIIIYQDKKGGENEWRKHHKSSITRDIWSYNKKTNTHQMLTTFKGEDRQPVFSPDENSIYYLSEESGSFNIHKMPLNSYEPNQKLTNFTLHPVRFLSIGNGILCFGYDGELYTMQEGQTPKKVKVTITTQDKVNSDKFIAVNKGVSEMAISPNGKEIAFVSRGEVFVTSTENAFTKRLTNTPENERFVSWGPEGKSVVYSSERNGKWRIYKTEKLRDEEPFFFASTVVKETPVIDNNADNYLAKYSPDGKKLAYIEDRRTLIIKDVATNKEISLLTPKDLYHMRDGDKYFTWSPDSKWLLVGWRKTLSNSEVLLLSVDGKKRINLTQSGFQDNRPKWVNNGKQMLWFSNRNGLKSYATSGQSESDVYSMFFTQDAWDKFNLSKEDFKLLTSIEALDKTKNTEKIELPKDTTEKKKEGHTTANLIFDWKHMIDRTKRLTIHSSRLGDAVLSKTGDKLYYLARFEKGMNLWTTNLRTKETKMILKLNTNFGTLQWDKDMSSLYLLSGGSIFKIDPEKGTKKTITIKGEMQLDSYAERQAMFDHVWIRTNAVFYHPDFHGVNWKLMQKEYNKYLPSIGNSFEFSELLSEMLGELNVSHSGSRYSGSNISNPDATASLGIIMSYKHRDNGLLIDEILSGGPLDKANFEVSPGMIIEKIDGITIEKNQDYAKYLNRKADKFMLLELFDPKTKKRQSITIKPISLGQENRLLYKRWVKINEDEVQKLSKGQLGYVHIPGMSDGPYRSIYQDMMGKYFDKKAMIIDTRFNGGGDLVADLAMFFTGIPFISYETEAKVVGGEPTSRWTKPTLAIFNESMYSDGHCFASGYTDLNIGKTVGMPVPGTCSFAGWERLPNGASWGVVPVSAKNKSGEWMENNQTEPMITIKNQPGIVDNGRDEQLEGAVREMLKDLKL